ncbi:MAG: hypothetical protein M3350_02405 [Actinomycetota bacterium]|nr:hypothetical protein [Actinomycetota bacterium]
MTRVEPLRLDLELDRQGDAIAGRLRRQDGEQWRFIGWLQLTRALEEARRDERPGHRSEGGR